MSDYVANKVYKLRKILGLTQLDFAKLLHIQQTAVSAYERGKTQPKLTVAQALVELGAKHGVKMVLTSLRKA